MNFKKIQYPKIKKNQSNIQSIVNINYKKIYRAGISLVVLIISISIMLVLSTAVIINFSSGENIFTTSNKAVFMSDVKTFETELEVSKLENITSDNGLVEDKMIYADENTLKYGSEVEDSANIYNLIPSLKNNSKYERRI